MTLLTIITTSRSRLEHIKQTLPRMLAQPGVSCVVVDYGCPDGTGDWVEAHHPQARVVRADNPPRFEAAKARNLGAAAAETPWLCFADADTILEPEFAQTVIPLLERGHYYRTEPRGSDSYGMCICHREDFDKVEGYDAVLQGWGMEDQDFYQRLEHTGLRLVRFPGTMLRMIPHGVDMRVQHFDIKTPELTSTLNLLYCAAKWDLARLERANVSLARREALYQQISALVLDAHAKGKPLLLRIALPARKTIAAVPLQSTLIYQLGPLTDESGRTLRQRQGHIRNAADLAREREQGQDMPQDPRSLP